jgi:hypothetical protein
MMKESPTFAKKKFLYRLTRSEYEKDWGKDYTKPDFGTRLWSVVLRYMPKIGPFKALAFNSPTPQTEELYFKSINTTVDQYRIYLQEIRAGSLELANYDFDTGKITKAAEYSLTDDSYAKLLGQLSDRKFDLTTPDLRDNILEFYSDLTAPIETKKDKDHWQSVLTSLDQLRLVTPVPAVADGPSQNTPFVPSERVTTPVDTSSAASMPAAK